MDLGGCWILSPPQRGADGSAGAPRVPPAGSARRRRSLEPEDGALPYAQRSGVLCCEVVGGERPHVRVLKHGTCYASDQHGASCSMVW